jgi:hypothetical protein
MKLTHYQAEGFYLISNLCAGGLMKCKLSTPAAINKGDALCDDGSGYVTDAGADLAATFVGIAAESTTVAGAQTEIMVIRPLASNKFSVPCDTAVATQSDVRELIDLGADSSHVNPADTLTTGWAFIVEDVDISAAALAADAQGYAIGHFEMRAAQS